MIEESTTSLYKFKFEYDDSEESQYVRKLYGEKYLQETNEERKMKLEKFIVELYNRIEADKANYERYMKLKSKQVVLSEDDINKVKDIIRETFKGMKTWTDGSEFYNDEDFLQRQLGKIAFNINRPRLGHNRKTHFGPLHSYSYGDLNKLREIFGRKIPIFKWVSNSKDTL
jgi:hypothetical protein